MTQNIKISKIKPNTGQIAGLPANPRFIRDEKYEALKKSLQDDPEMLELRELIVYPLGNDVVIIGGNMRFKAAEELGFEELPCKVLSPVTPVEKLRAITIKDNVPYGQWDMDILANEWDIAELEDWGMDLPFSGTEADPDVFFKDEDKKDKEPRTVICPHCGKEHEL